MTQIIDVGSGVAGAGEGKLAQVSLVVSSGAGDGGGWLLAEDETAQEEQDQLPWLPRAGCFKNHLLDGTPTPEILIQDLSL